MVPLQLRTIEAPRRTRRLSTRRRDRRRGGLRKPVVGPRTRPEHRIGPTDHQRRGWQAPSAHRQRLLDRRRRGLRAGARPCGVERRTGRALHPERGDDRNARRGRARRQALGIAPPRSVDTAVRRESGGRGDGRGRLGPPSRHAVLRRGGSSGPAGSPLRRPQGRARARPERTLSWYAARALVPPSSKRDESLSS